MKRSRVSWRSLSITRARRDRSKPKRTKSFSFSSLVSHWCRWYGWSHSLFRPKKNIFRLISHLSGMDSWWPLHSWMLFGFISCSTELVRDRPPRSTTREMSSTHLWRVLRMLLIRIFTHYWRGCCENPFCCCCIWFFLSQIIPCGCNLNPEPLLL